MERLNSIQKCPIIIIIVRFPCYAQLGRFPPIKLLQLVLMHGGFGATSFMAGCPSWRQTSSFSRAWDQLSGALDCTHRSRWKIRICYKYLLTKYLNWLDSSISAKVLRVASIGFYREELPRENAETSCQIDSCRFPFASIGCSEIFEIGIVIASLAQTIINLRRSENKMKNNIIQWHSTGTNLLVSIATPWINLHHSTLGLGSKKCTSIWHSTWWVQDIYIYI